jgi:hypothetical protein
MASLKGIENMKKFFYNTEKNKLYIFENSHSEFYYNNKKSLFENDFDYYIRGIISEENKILLRVFYPLPDIQEKNLVELLEFSNKALHYHLADIKRELILQGEKIGDILFNVTNEDAKNILKTCYI